MKAGCFTQIQSCCASLFSTDGIRGTIVKASILALAGAELLLLLTVNSINELALVLLIFLFSFLSVALSAITLHNRRSIALLQTFTCEYQLA